MTQKSIFLFAFLFNIIYGYSQITTINDLTLTTAINDGVINNSEYVGYSTGINAGFADVIGANSKIYFDSDITGNLNIGLEGGGGPFNDHVVIYFDANAGGYSNTVMLTDDGDLFRRAISAIGGSDITFAPGFEADFAIAITSESASLYQLSSGILVLIKTLTLNAPISPGIGGTYFELSLFNLSDIGLFPGDSFKFFITYLNATTGYRSNEFHGAANFGIPDENPGIQPIALSEGDYNTFISVSPIPTSINDNPFGNKLCAYPNPTSGELNISIFDTYFTGEVEVRYMSGQLVLYKKYKNSRNLRLNLEGKKGLYMLTIMNHIGQRANIKVIKE